MKWYRLAAEQGHAKAQFNLAAMYGNGKGVPEDDKEAVKWYRLAAEQGHLSAQHKLGLMYDNGEGFLKTTRQLSNGIGLLLIRDLLKRSIALA